MKIIVGLGNPGKKYEKTRHNVGFMVVEKLSEKLNVVFDQDKCNAIYGIYRFNNEKILIVKPQTYMNLSGEAVQGLMHFYNIDVKDLIVIHDDLDLPVGKLRLRQKGSSGGQKGMGNIIQMLNTSEINRIRIGIANDKSIDTADYVLAKLKGDDLKAINDSADKAVEAIIYSFEHNFDETMSKFN